jgi:hypothetical protein
MECLEFEILKTEMFEFQCVNIESWKLKIENWNLYVKHLEFEILKTEIFDFGCVNTESWKLKTEIWNLFVKCLNTEMFEYWKLETWMFKY